MVDIIGQQCSSVFIAANTEYFSPRIVYSLYAINELLSVFHRHSTLKRIRQKRARITRHVSFRCGYVRSAAIRRKTNAARMLILLCWSLSLPSRKCPTNGPHAPHPHQPPNKFSKNSIDEETNFLRSRLSVATFCHRFPQYTSFT